MKKIYILLYVLCFIWSLISVISAWRDPPTLQNLTVEEMIRYESMIFWEKGIKNVTNAISWSRDQV